MAAQLAAELDRPVVPCSTYAEALDGAGIVCACTHAVEPVVRRDWLAPGTHVTSVGYNTKGREVDDATVADALVVVESRASALAPIPAGTPDLTEPIAAGLIGPDHVHAEIGELVAGTRPGRTGPIGSRSTNRWAWRCRTPPRPRWCSRPRGSREWGTRSTSEGFTKGGDTGRPLAAQAAARPRPAPANRPTHALLLPRCRSVHTFGMRFPLDLIWLDRDGRVLRVDEAVPPWRVRSCRGAAAVLEAGRMPAMAEPQRNRFAMALDPRVPIYRDSYNEYFVMVLSAGGAAAGTQVPLYIVMAITGIWNVGIFVAACVVFELAVIFGLARPQMQPQ